MEIDKALEVINNVTANVNGTRQDHQIIVQAIQAITMEINKGQESIKVLQEIQEKEKKEEKEVEEIVKEARKKRDEKQ